MKYLVTENSPPSSISGDYEKITRGEFTVVYSKEVEVRQEDGKTYLFHGFISDREQVRASDGLYTALVIEDDRLKVFRDIFGSKPVYYATKDGSIVISSHIQPVLQSQPELRQVNRQVAADYLANGLVDHRRETFFQEVKRLQPREELRYDGKDIQVEETYYPSDGETGELKTLVKENIERLKPGDGDYYCPVSGGLDSTVTASQCGDARHIHLSFDHGTGDEEYFQNVKSEYGLDVEEVEVVPIDLLEEVGNTVRSQEEPTAFPPVQAQSILYQNIDDGSVVIAGTGSDELFYGYSWFVPFYLLEKLRERKPVEFLRELARYRKSLGIHHLHGMKDILLNGGVSLSSKAGDFVNAEAEPLKMKSLEDARQKHLENFYFPHALRSIEKNSHHHGVDVRAAFLSRQLLEFAESRDAGENFQEGLTKHLLRSSFKEELPDKVFNRKQKTGFVPASDSLYTQATEKELRKVFSSDSFQNRELVKSRKILKSLENGNLPFETAYRFYNYELWLREHID